ncbi:molybdenum cofactor biosysynthesis protein [Deinococcus piscis]|uniref:Molybdenum cofactor biosysynthesis protein n=1 Tax=Deinococcus piscis TaxID=394230 RepID=A0ABQ3JW99_9DEIO|nr:MOSC domain-containing protein [Deinococcus piscis]GHF92774.1 molybdenum cofactor biosysynthesis protein [Deinococcus piscis]
MSAPLPFAVLALYAGEPGQILVGQKLTRSGIAKQPKESLTISAAGAEGDHVANKKYHGGPDQALYLYTQADAEAWAALGLQAGLERAYFGENVRLSGPSSADVRPGDRFQLGEVLLEATAPRLPCALAAAYLAGDYPGSFVKDMYALGLPGIYARVIQGGTLRPGDVGEWQPTAQTGTPTLSELMKLHKSRKPDPAVIRRALAAPVSVRLREELDEKLSKALRHAPPSP